MKSMVRGPPPKPPTHTHTYTQQSNITGTIPVVPLRLILTHVYRHKAQSPRPQRNRGSQSEPWRGWEKLDKLLGPRALEGDLTLTILHIKTNPLKIF